MSGSELSLPVLFDREAGYDSALRAIRQKIAAEQAACPHAATVEIPPADDFDVPSRQCTACRKFLSR